MKHNYKLLITLIVTASLFFSLLLTGCGVSQSEVNKIISEKNTLQSELDTAVSEKTALQSELDNVISEKNTMQNQLDTIISEKNALQNQIDTMISENDALSIELDTAISENDVLRSELDEIKSLYPLRGFDTLSEFKDWMTDHVQPKTVYMDDAFLAAVKVQQAAMTDGYLFGIDIDSDEDGYSSYVYVTFFIGNELYWWFVEESDAYGNFDLKK